MRGPKPASLWARRRKIQLPYVNKFETLWEYKESFLAGRIDFPAYIGAACPVCSRLHCYRKINPYWRHAIELFPQFEKEKIPIARFLCRKKKRTFSLLPVQLIPYCQYTVMALIGTLLLGLESWRMGRKGFFGAMVALDPECLVTPWLVACWLAVVLQGLRRAHRLLVEFYDLSAIRTIHRTSPWQEAAGYFIAFGCSPQGQWGPPLQRLLHRYSHSTAQFLFGTPSQSRP